jgi:hypothetical protein
MLDCKKRRWEDAVEKKLRMACFEDELAYLRMMSNGGFQSYM